jgi:hypothetical protein
MYKDKDVHEIHTVKFGGDPTDKANKIVLLRANHRVVSDWWERQKRNLQRGIPK